jgi:dipeptidase D
MTKPTNYPSNPKHLWDIFYDFTQTPRPSKFESKISAYLLNLAKNKGLRTNVDKVGNIIIYVPGKNGRENDEALIIQNHIDMVTDAIPGHQINFKEDPLEVFVEDGWLKARGTTLGADNGIGCAASLAAIFDDSLVHPPLELLFTIDEETGLNGARGIETEFLSGKKMLNLDTEEWGSVYIGCAGGIDYDFNKDLSLEASELDTTIKIQVSDFIGGHSGLDIHEQRGNANKVLAQLLFRLNTEVKIELVEMRVGRAHNIIPRDGYLVLNTEKSSVSTIEEIIKSFKSELLGFLPKNDQKFRIELSTEHKSGKDVVKGKELKSIISYLNLFPHGAHSYDTNDRSITATSNNFAIVIIMNGKFYALSSLRFFDRNEIKPIEYKLISLSESLDFSWTKNSEYPSWKPLRENPVLDTVVDVYKETFKEEPIITAIHAGLECGILRDKIGPIDVCSFGPTINGAHSPDERVHIDSVESFWKLFKNTLARI